MRRCKRSLARAVVLASLACHVSLACPGCSVPTVGGPLVFGDASSPADAATESGSRGDASPGGALVGDPCAGDSECSSGTCADGIWCSATCTSNDGCGANSAGVQGVCALASTGQMACYPGCSPGSACQAYPGTQCVQTPSGGAVCSP